MNNRHRSFAARLIASLSLLVLAGIGSAQEADQKVVLVITADAGDYILAASGTITKMLENGAEGYLVRVTNDDKDSWDLTPEETARRTREESEQAAKILGFKEVESLGYRAGELGGVSPSSPSQNPRTRRTERHRGACPDAGVVNV